MVRSFAERGLLGASSAPRSRRASRPRNDLTQVIKMQAKVAVAVSIRKQSMVHEVKRGRLELYLLMFLDLELLEHGEVAVPVHRARKVGDARISELVIRLRLKAAGVGKIIGLQTLFGIAHQLREHGHLRRTQQVGRILCECASLRYAEVPATGRGIGQLHPALDRGDTGDHPAVGGSPDEGVAALNLGQEEYVYDVQGMPAVLLVK